LDINKDLFTRNVGKVGTDLRLQSVRAHSFLLKGY